MKHVTPGWGHYLNLLGKIPLFCFYYFYSHLFLAHLTKLNNGLEISNIKALGLVVRDKKIFFFIFPYINL